MSLAIGVKRTPSAPMPSLIEGMAISLSVLAWCWRWRARCS